jgi:hypothetical protein
MKKALIFFFLIINMKVYSQNMGINYQAVILKPVTPNVTGKPLSNTRVCMSFKIIDGNAQIEYQETIETTTDQFGIVNLVIGTGNQTNGYASSFDKITWNLLSKSLITSINVDGTCANFTEISNQPFSAVPFALFAANAPLINATNTIKGSIQLSGDLAGFGSSASNPIISDYAITTSKVADAAITDNKIASGISASKVGLGNVNNTSDASKPISTATQTALNEKVDITDTTAMLLSYAKQAATLSEINKKVNIADTTVMLLPYAKHSSINSLLDLKASIDSPNFTGTVSGITAVMVGLDSVNNTSDLNKPISIAQQVVFDQKFDNSRVKTFNFSGSSVVNGGINLIGLEGMPALGAKPSSLRVYSDDEDFSRSASFKPSTQVVFAGFNGTETSITIIITF